MATLIRVYVVDSQPVFCEGIQAVLETATNLQLLGTAISLEQHCSWVSNQPPHVLLLAANTSHDSLLETALALKQKQKGGKILVMLTHPHERCLHRLIAQGVKGCILKTDAPQNFIRAIHAIADDERWFSRKLMQETLQTQPQLVTQLQLTEQDKILLQLVCAEKSNCEIAMILHMSERTICRYLEIIYLKLGTSTRVGTAVQAVKLGLA